jgi:hypothetical protein
MRKVILIVLLLQFDLAFAQSKKDQIEILRTSFDSLSKIVINERNFYSIESKKLNASIQWANYQIDSLFLELKNKKSKINEYEKEILDLKQQLTYKTDSLHFISEKLKKLSEIALKKVDENRTTDHQNVPIASFNSTDYDFDKNSGENFIQNKNTIVKKEKTRIIHSKYAKREGSLSITLKTGETISLVSKSELDGMQQTHYAYLFEDELKSKIYYVLISYIAPGSGDVNYSLIEIDLNTGEKTTLVTDVGGNFSFNSNNTFLVVSGWYDSEEYVQDNQLQIINIQNSKSQLTLTDVEPINITWLSNDEFQCQLLKYTKEKEWPFSRIPNELRTGKLIKFSFVNGSWSRQ